MAKPPADADPEKFIIGRGAYGNIRIAAPFYDDGIFRIDPAPMPSFSQFAFVNVLFGSFCFGFGWLFKTYGQFAPWEVYGVPIVLGLLLCGGSTLLLYFVFDKARRLGPWLIYNIKTGRLELPREKVAFARNEIVHLQYITTKRLNGGGIVNNEELSELNLVTCREEVRKRWPMLRSSCGKRAFDEVLKPLLEHTDLPVVRVKDNLLGWKVTEHPYLQTSDE